MTREEAIICLKADLIYDYMTNTVNHKEHDEALKLAIQALSQEPCEAIHGSTYGGVSWGGTYKPQEPCDDAISRDAVDKYIARLLSGYLYDGERERLEIFSAWLWELPSVTQKSGKWIIRDDLSTVRYYQCSECNEINSDNNDYCPNCGAYMVGPKESEE